MGPDRLPVFYLSGCCNKGEECHETGTCKD